MISDLKTYIVDFGIEIITLDYLVIKNVVSKYASKNITILDIGSGTGRLARLFSPKKYIGIDIDEKSIELAKKNYSKYDFRLGDATNFKIKKKFDLILISGVMHHLSNKDFNKSLETIKSHLKKNGKVVFIEAVYPIHRWNIAGRFLRNLDQGHNIRSLKEYKNFVNRKLKVLESYEKAGGLVDYAVVIAEK